VVLARLPYWVYLLLLVPLSVATKVLHASDLAVFVFACAAIIPLSLVMGIATSELSGSIGPHWGALLSATFGNATELIIGLIAVRHGLFGLARASIVGSVIGNILLVLGGSILIGGTRYKIQHFNKDLANSQSVNLLLASASLAVPAIFLNAYHTGPSPSPSALVSLSVGVAMILLVVYIASLWFSLHTHETLFRSSAPPTQQPPSWPAWAAICVLAVVAIIVAYESDWLVSTVRAAAVSLKMSQIFIGIIIIPIIGNAAEHGAAIMMARRNQMEVTMGITIGSSIQVAMFVAPILCIASVAFGHPLIYVFSTPQLTATSIAVLIGAFIARDGKTHWLEGAQLLCAYAIIALSFYFIP
jgi:Ca2+:H+ antiporter